MDVLEKKKMRKDETRFEVKVDLKGLEQGEKRPVVKVYLFSSSGELLDTGPVNDDGRATLKTGYGFGEKGRFKITAGPGLEETRLLRKARARSVSVQAVLGERLDVGLDVYRPEWECWYGFRYEVVGDVKKRIQADADTTVYAPVCTSTVEIYEVDYLGLIMTLPEYVLERFREELLRIPEEFPVLREPFPIPPVPPRPPAGPLAAKKTPGTGVGNIRSCSGASSLPGPEKTAVRTTGAASSGADTSLNYVMLKKLPAATLREYIIDNIAVFRPYFCLYRLGLYPLTLLGTAHTDTNGRFNKSLFFFCHSEQPDLYFKVRQCISGSPSYVYAPEPVPCHTYWNHPSGQEVHLTVTDGRARCHFENPSVDKPGIYVMPIGIGNDGWWQIHQGHLKPPETADANRGLYHPEAGTTFDPYGKTLDLTMQFHDGLRDPAGPNVRYYRWSFRREGASGWTNIDTPVVHRYLDQTDPDHPKIRTYRLGPNPNPDAASDEDNLFEVPPDLDWFVEHDRHDRPFAKWDTTAIPAA